MTSETGSRVLGFEGRFTRHGSSEAGSARAPRLRTRLLLLRLLVIATLVAGSGCQSLQLERVGVVSESDWLTEGYTPGRQSALDVYLEPPLEEAWVYNAQAGFGQGSPLILGDVVLVATRKGEVHAIELETGRRLGSDSFGEAVEGTPVLHQGTLFVPVDWGRRALYAYDLRRATKRWDVKGAPIAAGLLVTGGHVIAADIRGRVAAYEHREGKRKWERELGKRTAVRATPIMAGGQIVVATDRGAVFALSPANGEPTWTRSAGAPVYDTPAADAVHVYVPTTRGRFVALDVRTGEQRWSYSLPDTTVRFTGPAVADDQVVFGGTDGKVRALDTATGTELWTFKAGDALTAAPLIVAETVFVGTLGRKLYALDRTSGTVLWEKELEGRVKSAMAAQDGLLVVLSEPHNVYLFRSTGPASHVVTE